VFTLEKLGFESLGIWNSSSEKKKKTSTVGLQVLVSGCDGRRCLWWPVKLQRTTLRKKKIQLFDDCVVEIMFCGHRLSLFSTKLVG
jgi:hypothetical protein